VRFGNRNPFSLEVLLLPHKGREWRQKCQKFGAPIIFLPQNQSKPQTSITNFDRIMQMPESAGQQCIGLIVMCACHFSE
jgi:hypothetical protein